MNTDQLNSIKSVVQGLWPKANAAQVAVLCDGVKRYELESVSAIVQEVFRTKHKGFGDAVGQIVARCRESANERVRTPAPKKADEWTPPTEGHTPGELCDMAYAGTLEGPLANATPRGRDWMRWIGEKRERARREGREPFEPTGMDLIAATTALGSSRVGKKSKRDA